jgi:hypothetical protein
MGIYSTILSDYGLFFEKKLHKTMEHHTAGENRFLSEALF